MDDHAIRYLRGTRGQKVPSALHLHHAYTAGSDAVYHFDVVHVEMTERRYLHADFFRSLQYRDLVFQFEFIIIYC
jgi:hypothetical protein